MSNVLSVYFHEVYQLFDLCGFSLELAFKKCCQECALCKDLLARQYIYLYIKLIGLVVIRIVSGFYFYMLI